MSEANDHHADYEHGIVETLKSLIMAFVLAMTFRGFVTEGFVIPTGSMAPTLLGQYALVESDATGSTFPVDFGPNVRDVNMNAVADIMLARPEFEGWGTTSRETKRRMGDRILVLKTLYPFFAPHRFDVVVFKNPTEPDGASANYIKRLIGLPDEKIWLADGDVFAGPADDPDNRGDYRIQRKPEHVQRGVWQPVYHSDYIPIGTDRYDWRYDGPPWRGDDWETAETRVYRCDTADPSMLQWNNDIRSIDDWTAYNQPSHASWNSMSVPDVRVSAGIIAEKAGLQTSLQLITRSHQYEFSLAEGAATVRLRPIDGSSDWLEQTGEFEKFAPGEACSIEFWHVDQSMSIFVNGNWAVYLEYDWLPMARMRYASGMLDEGNINLMLRMIPDPPEIRWLFEGAPVSLHRVNLDRDLYYRTARMDRAGVNAPVEGYEHLVRVGSWGFGTHPDKPAVLGPDHFLMLGDNSARSLDGRIWGAPHPLVAQQIDPAPFVVNRKLLIGKAWVVYFPSMYSLTDKGRSFIPDFGRMRFIR